MSKKTIPITLLIIIFTAGIAGAGIYIANKSSTNTSSFDNIEAIPEGIKGVEYKQNSKIESLPNMESDSYIGESSQGTTYMQDNKFVYSYDGKRLSFVLPDGWRAEAKGGRILLLSRDSLEEYMELYGFNDAKSIFNIPHLLADITIDIVENSNNVSIEEYASYFLNEKHVTDEVIDEYKIADKRTVVFKTKIPRDVFSEYIEGMRVIVSHSDYFIDLRTTMFFEKEVIRIANTIEFNI